MLKMLLDPMGGIVMTNDGNCILREVDVSHPAAKSMIELSRAQDEEVGDGTTSVIILSGEILSMAEPLLERNFHPTVIVSGYVKALQKSLEVCASICRTIDVNNNNELREIVTACIGTKFSSRWSDLMVDMAIKDVKQVVCKVGDRTEVDIKRFVRIEKIPGTIILLSPVAVHSSLSVNSFLYTPSLIVYIFCKPVSFCVIFRQFQ
jgi:T-complex protein 1 subunit gamma